MDSRVSLGVVAKGRTSSWMLRKVLMKINAVCLAASLSPLLGYCRSHLNPADAPSRVTTPAVTTVTSVTDIVSGLDDDDTDPSVPRARPEQ